MYTVVFIDTEVSAERNMVLDYGAAADGSTHIHTKSAKAFEDFLIEHSTGSKRFLCGHNIVHHDARYIRQQMQAAGITDVIDTLYLSPLLFPDKPYHALCKDDKQICEAFHILESHLETAPPRDSSHLQTPNPDTIADATKHLLTGAWYSCPLRGLTNTDADTHSQPSN